MKLFISFSFYMKTVQMARTKRIPAKRVKLNRTTQPGPDSSPSSSETDLTGCEAIVYKSRNYGVAISRVTLGPPTANRPLSNYANKGTAQRIRVNELASNAKRSQRHEPPLASSTPKPANTKRSKPKRKRRDRVMSEIRCMQKTTEPCVPLVSFYRVIREITVDRFGQPLLLTKDAINALRESAEMFVTDLLSDSYQCALHANRRTLMPKDINLVRYIRGPNDLSV